MRFNLIPISLLVLVFATSCVPKQKYTELEQTLDYYKGEALSTDSIRGANLAAQSENNKIEGDYQTLIREMEQLKATNISLNQNYQDVVHRYNTLVNEKGQVLTTTSYQTAALEEELALRREELDEKERDLSSMEYQIRDREAEIQRLEARGPSGPTGYSAVPDAQYQNLRNEKALINQRISTLENYFRQVLVGFPEQEVGIERTNEGLKLVLSQALLFSQSDEQVYWKGRQALQQIAVVLRENPDLAAKVVGHANPSSDFDYDWTVSTKHATAVAKDLITFGVVAENITAGAQGGSDPIVSPTDARAQILNGRTELHIPMDFSAILLNLD